MNEREAKEALHGAELLPLMQGPIAQIKKVIADLLDADIPAMGGMPPNAGKG